LGAVALIFIVIVVVVVVVIVAFIAQRRQIHSFFLEKILTFAPLCHAKVIFMRKDIMPCHGVAASKKLGAPEA
jgi:hypothetical protein